MSPGEPCDRFAWLLLGDSAQVHLYQGYATGLHASWGEVCRGAFHFSWGGVCTLSGTFLLGSDASPAHCPQGEFSHKYSPREKCDRCSSLPGADGIGLHPS